jgi:hypothetical protein
MDPSGGRGGSMTTMPTLTTATLTQWLSAFPLFLSTATSDFIAKLFSGHQRSDCTPRPPSLDEHLPEELGGGKRFPTEKNNGTTSLTISARKKWDSATEAYLIDSRHFERLERQAFNYMLSSPDAVARVKITELQSYAASYLATDCVTELN